MNPKEVCAGALRSRERAVSEPQQTASRAPVRGVRDGPRERFRTLEVGAPASERVSRTRGAAVCLRELDTAKAQQRARAALAQVQDAQSLRAQGARVAAARDLRYTYPRRKGAIPSAFFHSSPKELRDVSSIYVYRAEKGYTISRVFFKKDGEHTGLRPAFQHTRKDRTHKESLCTTRLRHTLYNLSFGIFFDWLRCAFDARAAALFLKGKGAPPLYRSRPQSGDSVGPELRDRGVAHSAKGRERYQLVEGRACDPTHTHTRTIESCISFSGTKGTFQVRKIQTVFKFKTTQDRSTTAKAFQNTLHRHKAQKRTTQLRTTTLKRQTFE